MCVRVAFDVRRERDTAARIHRDHKAFTPRPHTHRKEEELGPNPVLLLVALLVARRAPLLRRELTSAFGVVQGLPRLAPSAAARERTSRLIAVGRPAL